MERNFGEMDSVVAWYDALTASERAYLQVQFGMSDLPDREIKFFEWLVDSHAMIIGVHHLEHIKKSNEYRRQLEASGNGVWVNQWACQRDKVMERIARTIVEGGHVFEVTPFGLYYFHIHYF